MDTTSSTDVEGAGAGGPTGGGFGEKIPGLAAAAAVMLVSLPVAEGLGGRLLALQGIDPSSASSPISAALVAIVLGLLLRNTLALPDNWRPGIQFSMRTVLRAGIVLIGVKLSLADMVRLGAGGVPIVVVSIASGLLLVTWITARLGLPSRLGALIAAGTGICGVTAILSVAPGVEAGEEEVAYAVANVTFFGLLGMFAYPYLAPALLPTSEQIGMWLGVAVHDTAQVIGAALTYRALSGDDVAFQAATVTKLTRNLFLVVVVPLLSYYYGRGRGEPAGRAGGEADSGPSTAKGIAGGGRRWTRFVPPFVVGFVLMAVGRTVGDGTAASGAAFGLLAPEGWRALVVGLGDVWGAKYALGTAMAAVGLGTHFSVFRGVGLRPFLVGLAGAVFVGLVGLAMVWALGSFVRL